MSFIQFVRDNNLLGQVFFEMLFLKCQFWRRAYSIRAFFNINQKNDKFSKLMWNTKGKLQSDFV